MGVGDRDRHLAGGPHVLEVMTVGQFDVPRIGVYKLADSGRWQAHWQGVITDFVYDGRFSRGASAVVNEGADSGFRFGPLLKVVPKPQVEFA